MANALTRLILDPAEPSRAHTPRAYLLGDDWRTWGIPAALGAALVALSLIGLATDAQRFFFAYLVGWVYCVSIAIGALFFVMIQHITKARWSTTVRRIPELIVANFPLLALLGVPILFGMHDLYHWTHEELYVEGTPAYDEILAGKRAYLNTPFFLGRLALYLLVWSYLGRRLYGLSVANDRHPDAENTHALRRVSAWGIPVMAVTTAFAGYDLIMSLDPHWFSTIFGVYFFAGGWLANFAFMTFLALWLRRRGMLEHEVNREHIQDLGKFIFAFTVFWAYIAFSQYMLYWYGNLPEEVVWFQNRLSNGWQYLGLALLFGHFIIPFFVLIARPAKRMLPLLAVMCVWTLVMHWMDLAWLSFPAIHHGAPSEHAGEGDHAAAWPAVGPLLAQAETSPELDSPLGPTAPTPPAGVAEAVESHEAVPAHFSWVDFTAWLGLFGLFVGATLWRASRHAITPYNDPYFPESVRFENI